MGILMKDRQRWAAFGILSLFYMPLLSHIRGLHIITAVFGLMILYLVVCNYEVIAVNEVLRRGTQ